jgi:hypothetical protein
MLGIPPPGTPERKEFKAQFWPALWSGIVSSILTGVIVGLLLLYWQRSVEDRAARQSYTREVSVLRQNIREAVAIPDVFRIGSARSSVPPQAEAVMKVLRELPISMWREELSHEKPFLDSVHDFQRAYAAFVSSATEFDTNLSQFARSYNAARGVIQVNDGMVAAYVLGRFQGFEAAKLSQWLDLESKEIPPWLEEALASASKDDKLRKSHQQYATARNALVAALKRLIQSVDA